MERTTHQLWEGSTAPSDRHDLPNVFDALPHSLHPTLRDDHASDTSKSDSVKLPRQEPAAVAEGRRASHSWAPSSPTRGRQQPRARGRRGPRPRPVGRARRGPTTSPPSPPRGRARPLPPAWSPFAATTGAHTGLPSTPLLPPARCCSFPRCCGEAYRAPSNGRWGRCPRHPGQRQFVEHAAAHVVAAGHPASAVGRRGRAPEQRTDDRHAGACSSISSNSCASLYWWTRTTSPLASWTAGFPWATASS